MMGGHGRRCCVGLAIALLVPVGLAFAPRGLVGGESPNGEPLWSGQGWGLVRFDQLGQTLLIPGITCSATQILIDPKVEVLADEPSVMGVFGVAAPTRIIEVVPEGTVVQKDDVICRLDPKAYVERTRLQRIEVDRVASSKAEADRAVSVAEAELVAFRDGDRLQQESQPRS